MESLLNDFGRVFLLELILACAITICGCYTTYTDIHFRYIPNWASWGLLAVGLISQGLFWLWGAVELDQAGIGFLVGFVVSYALYIYGFWAPGDAKLFWAFVLVLPPTFFSSTSLSSFNAPIWALLLNALVLTYLVLLVLWALLRRGRSAEAKVGLDASQWLYLGLELAGLIGLVLGFGTFLLVETMTFVEVVVAILVLYLLVDRFVPRSCRLTLALPGLILGGYTALESGEWPIYLTLWIISWGVFLAYHIIKRLAPRAFLQAMPIQALREGMVPRLAIYARDRARGYRCGTQVEQGQDVLCYVGRPLTKVQVRTLHEKSASGSFAQFGNELEVELAVPFAPIIAVAGVLTVALGGSLIKPLIQLFSPWLLF
ncbi:MAG: A24 family peptidase [Gemmatimonadota bacterium]|nr:A24 family peptidase [Gemmatimonadota bacterium]